MQIKLETESKTIILENSMELKFSDIFNFIHKVDPDNAGDWVIRTEPTPCYTCSSFPSTFTYEVSNS